MIMSRSGLTINYLLLIPFLYEPITGFLFFGGFLKDQMLFNFTFYVFFQSGYGPDVPYRINSINEDLSYRINAEIS